MAQAAQSQAVELAPAESKEGEELRNELLAFLRDYKPKASEDTPGLLEGRYRIHPEQALPQYDTLLARACRVVDTESPEGSLYALICPMHMPMRQKLARQLRNINHLNLIALVGQGVVALPPNGEQRFVLVYETPKGRKLSELIAEQRLVFPDNFIHSRIIAPIVSVLALFEEMNIPHGRLNPDNIFFGDSVMVGECISEPCGYSQDFHFEPISRMQALPAGKGEGSISQDYYALGVLVAWLKVGAGVLAEKDLATHIRRLLQDGSYAALVGNREMSDPMNDFLRGTLTDSEPERWRYPQVKAWLGGKRYNLLAPGINSTGSRAFAFKGMEYNNFRSLAQGLDRHWEDAVTVLRDGTLARWAELSARRKDTAEMLTRATKSLGGEVGRGERQNSELVARALTIIDPSAPLRMREVSARIDGIGPLLAESMHESSERMVNLIAEVIEQGLASVWGELQRKLHDDMLPQDMVNAIQLIDKVRMLLRAPGFGFGIERCVYELNPDLPCLSPLLSGYYVTTLPQLLTALDQLAPRRASAEEAMDRHIAAFVACKLGLMQDIAPKEFKHVPELQRHRGLIALRVLQVIQQKAGHPKLPGLSAWMTAGVAPVLDRLHSNSLRKQMVKALRHQAIEGYLTPIATLMFNPDYLAADQNGFHHASEKYMLLGLQADQLKDSTTRLQSAREWGHGLARAIAYLIFTVTLVTVTQARL